MRARMLSRCGGHRLTGQTDTPGPGKTARDSRSLRFADTARTVTSRPMGVDARDPYQLLQRFDDIGDHEGVSRARGFVLRHAHDWRSGGPRRDAVSTSLVRPARGYAWGRCAVGLTLVDPADRMHARCDPCWRLGWKADVEQRACVDFKSL